MLLKRLAPLLAALFIVAVAAACPPQVGSEVEGKVSGRIVKGPVSGATVSVFAVNDSGRRTGEAVGTATSADDGTFAVNVHGHAGPALVCGSGGIYVEESTGGLVQLAGNEVCALVENHELGKETAGVLLTPFSTWHAALTGCFVEGGRDASLPNASSHAALRLNDFLSAGQTGYDFRTTQPFDVTAGTAPSLTPDVWQGILLAGLSESAKGYAVASGLDPGVRVTAATLMTALSQDIDDGACVFDGQSTSGVLSQGTVQLSADSLRGAPQGFGSGILRFLENPDRNLSGVTSGDVTDLVVRLNAHESEIFGEGHVTGDVDAPVVAFVAPEDGAPVIGLLTVTVTASDANAIEEFAFDSPSQLLSAERSCDDESHCTLTASLNPTLEQPGELVLRAHARDTAGNVGEANVSVFINDAAPVLAVTSPTAGRVSGAAVVIAAEASDSDGVQSLTLTGIDAANLSVASTPPNQISATWNTLTTPEGPVTLTFTAIDVRGVQTEQVVVVEVDNLEDNVVTGVVDVGAPVRGASVSAFAFDASGRGALVATTTSSGEDEAPGSFTLVNPFYSGALLLRVAGGSYEDPATGAVHQLRDGQELLTLIENVQPGEATRANINAWTTLSSARTETVLGANIEDTIATDNKRLGLHLRRDGPETNPLPILITTSADLSTEVIESTNDRAVLALAHAGLSRMALEVADAVDLDPGAITLVDLVSGLSRDMRNGLFDGLDGDGLSVVFDPGARVAATPLTLRRELAGAVANFLADVPLDDGSTFGRNQSGITADVLFGPGRFFEDISLNNDFRLFATAGEPFDIVPPEVALVFEADAAAFPGTVRTERDVVIKATAADLATGVSRFTIAFPGGLTDLSGALTEEIRVSVPPSFGPNMADLSGQCASAAALDPLLTDLNPDEQFCLCVAAADAVENVAHKVFCFTRPAPSVDVTSPLPDQVFNATDVSVGFSARIIGGWELTGCSLTAPPATPLSAAPDANNECILQGAVPRSTFSDGRHTVTVTGFDIATLSGERQSDFLIETIAPGVVITAPTQGFAFSSANYTVTGTVDDPDVTRVEVSIVRPALNGETVTSAVVTSFSGATRQWQLAVTDTAGQNKSGPRRLTAVAVDGSGNRSVTVARDFVVDDRAPALPALTSPAAGQFRPEGPSVAVERTGNGLCLAGTQFCGVDRRVPAPAAARGSATVLFTAQNLVTRTIERWSNRYNDVASAPATIVNAVDVGGAGIREVRFRVATTCATATSQLTQSLAVDGNGDANLRLTGNLGFDLLNAHQRDSDTPLCLSVGSVDKAGLNSGLAHLFFRWRTIAPPLNVAAISSTGLSDQLDVARFNGNGAGVTSFLRGDTSTYRAFHVYVHNPHAEAVTFQVPATQVALTLKTTTQRRFAGVRATKWAGAATFALTNPADLTPEVSSRPDWTTSGSSGANAQVFKATNACGATSCVATAAPESPPPCTFISTCNEGDATFNDDRFIAQTSPREIIALTPQYSCNAVGVDGLPITSQPCTGSGGIFNLAPGQTAILSATTSHLRGARDFLAPGWNAQIINPIVPFFDDGEPVVDDGNDTEIMNQTPTLPRDVVLWLKDASGAVLPRTLLWVGNNSQTCGTGVGRSECHYGREYRRIDQVDVEAETALSGLLSPSQWAVRTRHGNGGAIGQSEALWTATGVVVSLPAVVRSVAP